MYCACIWDEETEQVCRFFWVSTWRRAKRLAAKYAKITGKESFVETEQHQSNYSHAAGYHN